LSNFGSYMGLTKMRTITSSVFQGTEWWPASGRNLVPVTSHQRDVLKPIPFKI